MDSPNQKEFTFDEIKAALLDNAAPFPAQMVYFFSDISAKDLRSLKEVWPQIWLDRRRGLLEDMETMSEADTLLFFDNVALMALDDEDPVARSTAIHLLWQSEEEKLAPRLLTLMVEDPNPIVRAAAATGLGIFVYLGELEEISAETFNQVETGLIEVHRGSDEILVRRRALEALGYASHPDVPVFIQQAYESNDEDWLQTALFAMGRSCDQGALCPDGAAECLSTPTWSFAMKPSARQANLNSVQPARPSLICWKKAPMTTISTSPQSGRSPRSAARACET